MIDPELHANIVELGMVDDIRVEPDGAVMVRVALTTAGCPLRAQIKRDVESKVRGLPGVTAVAVEYGEMTAEQKTAAMQRARWNARENAAPTEVPSTTRVLAVASGKGGVGKSSVTVNLAAALAARGLTVGVLDADIWGFSVPRMLGVEGRLGGTEGKITPNLVEVPNRDGGRTRAAQGRVDGLPRRRRGHRVDVAGPDPHQGARAVPHRRPVGRHGLPARSTCRPAPATSRWGLRACCPQAEMLVVTTPALAAQKVAVRVADMARRSYMKVVGVVENMSELVLPDGSRHAVFGTRRRCDALAAEIGAPLVGRIPLEPAVSQGGDEGRPVALTAPGEPAGRAFHALADRLVDDLLPPIEMSGCTARLLDLLPGAQPTGRGRAEARARCPGLVRRVGCR